MIPAYERVGYSFLFRTALLVIGLLAGCSFIYLIASRRLFGLNSWLGFALAMASLVATYLAGGLGGLLFGKGEGRLAAATFLAMSLLLAAFRGDAGCELMSMPATLFRGRSRLPCAVFTPIDWFEQKLRGRHFC